MSLRPPYIKELDEAMKEHARAALFDAITRDVHKANNKLRKIVMYWILFVVLLFLFSIFVIESEFLTFFSVVLFFVLLILIRSNILVAQFGKIFLKYENTTNILVDVFLPKEVRFADDLATNIANLAQELVKEGSSSANLALTENDLEMELDTEFLDFLF